MTELRALPPVSDALPKDFLDAPWPPREPAQPDDDELYPDEDPRRNPDRSGGGRQLDHRRKEQGPGRGRQRCAGSCAITRGMFLDLLGTPLEVRA